MNFSNLLNISEQSQIQSINPADFNTAYDLDGGRLYTKVGDINKYLYYRTEKHVEYNLSTGGLSTGATTDKHGWLITGDYYAGGMPDNRVISGNTWVTYDNIITPVMGTLPSPYDIGMYDIGTGTFNLINAVLGDTFETVIDLELTPATSGLSINSDVRLYVQTNAGNYFEVGDRLITVSDGSAVVKQVRLLLPITDFLQGLGVTPNFKIQFKSKVTTTFSVRGVRIVVWR